MMKNIFLLLFLVLIIACNQQDNESGNIKNKKTVPKSEEQKQVNFSEKNLIAFMDSVGRLPTDPLAKKVSSYADSVFLDIKQINRRLNKLEFNTLKTAIRKRAINLAQAEKIFGKIDLDSNYLGKKIIPIKFYSFDQVSRNYREFAISFSKERARGNTNLYFFNADSLLVKKSIYNYYGLELNYYKDLDRKTIVYYKEDYITGSGIWWNNLYFYKYYNNHFIPILNELANGNSQNDIWGPRVKWLKSIIQKTNPLVLKIVYYQGLNYMKGGNVETKYLLNDSTMVAYKWDEKSRTLKGIYENSKITKPEIFTYYVLDNELLYINIYHDLLKKKMNDEQNKKLIVSYLNSIKNHEEGNESK